MVYRTRWMVPIKATYFKMTGTMKLQPFSNKSKIISKKIVFETLGSIFKKKKLDSQSLAKVLNSFKTFGKLVI